MTETRTRMISISSQEVKSSKNPVGDLLLLLHLGHLLSLA